MHYSVYGVSSEAARSTNRQRRINIRGGTATAYFMRTHAIEQLSTGRK